MAINYSNVHLTIDQFQRVSNGTFNAGEVRLVSETEIEKVNNFIGRKWKNKESISHAQVIAIKQAFVTALQEGGVGDDALRRVREQLGLAPDRAVDTKLNERSLKPLSRQQIREILDQNAEAINGTVGAGTIRTSDELYAGVDDATRRYRASKRDEANAELATRRTVTTQRRFCLFQALLAGDVDYRSEDDRAELLKMAKEALGIVLQVSNGHPRADRAAKISWGANGERRFTMEAGTDEATFARRMEDVIVRLTGLAPDADAAGLRAAFRAVPHGERSQWIDNMISQGGDKVPYKVRTLAVALLQDAGVDDYDSLSFPNRLPDEAAKTLLRNLAALPEGASAEQARQCLDAARNLADDAKRSNLAYVPATSTENFNAEIVSAFANSNERLFGQYQTLATDVLADQGGNVRLVPEAMRDALKTAAIEAAAKRALDARVKARIAELGISLKVPATAVNSLKNRVPDLLGRLAASHTPEDVAAVLDSVLDQMDAELRRASAVQTYRAQFGAMVRAELSARTGIPVSALGENALSRARISELSAGVVHKIGQGKLPSDTPEQIEQAFRDAAARFAAERAAILEKCDTLALSDAVKGELKEWLLAQDKVGYLDLDAILDEAGKIDFAPLAAALRGGRPKADVYSAMKPFSDSVFPTVARLLAGKVDVFGAPEISNVSGILLIVAFDRHPGIRNDLSSFFARPEVQADADERFVDDHESYPSRHFVPFGKPPAAEARAELARQIADGTPPPVFAQALARAVQAEDIRFPSEDPSVEGRKLSPDEAVAVFAAHTKLGQALAEILQSFSGELTPPVLELLARSALHHHGIGDVSAMVESMRDTMLGKIQGFTLYGIPDKYIAEAHSVLGDLRDRFGEEWVPKNAPYSEVADLAVMGSQLTPVVNAAKAEHRVVSPAEFRTVAASSAEYTIIGNIVKAEANAIAAELHLAPLPGTFRKTILRCLPALRASLLAARSPNDVRAALDASREAIRTLAQQEVQLTALVNGAEDAMAEKLAGRFGIEPAEVRQNFGYAVVLAERMGKLKDEIMLGTYPGCREPGFSAEAAVKNIIDNLVEEYVEKLVVVDGLQNVSDETREALRGVIRSQNRPDKTFVDARRAQRVAAKVDGAALFAALGDPNATDEVRFEAIRKYADEIMDAVAEEFREELQDGGLGSDELQPVIVLVRTFVIGANPGLDVVLERLSSDPFVLRVGGHFQQEEHQDYPLRASVATTLF